MLNEGGGQLYVDSAFGDNGSGVNSPTRGVGQYGPFVTLNGTTQNINLGLPLRLSSLRSSFSVSGWIKIPSLSGVQRFFGSTTQGFSFGTNGTGLRFTTHGVADYDSSTITLTAGLWYNLVAVMDASFAVTFFVNGLSRQTVSGPAQGNVGAGIYNIGSSAAEFLNGSVFLVRVYNRVLTSTEVLNLYVAPFSDVISQRKQYYSAPAVTGSLFLPANLALGAGGPFFSDKLAS